MTPQFLTPLDVRLLPESDNTRWMLLAPLSFYSDAMKCVVTVPANFVTDFVSFEPLKNIGQRPAVIHDYLYSCSNVDRATADEVLREALESVGIDQGLADAMFAAVRLFGGGHKANVYEFVPE